ncbi:hypothetical protein KQH90_12010 [Anaerosalibacter bizertensis]|uniref:hypothetical protein n=1 Tax=Anaerosalibacter bizertensis TaxID=932217 RepID=UPI001C0F30C5|nr:hypothetical protein [Anaerosalibacter bizertensis]MBU5294752.1 hypothetical protein [Anaerosalibacter bizertensis]
MSSDIKDIKSDVIDLGITDRCCDATTGCEWDGSLRRVRPEPIFTQKVYDATLVNLQALRTITDQHFHPHLGRNARIVKVLDVRCRKFFNPDNINDPCNLKVDPDTVISGGDFVKDGKGNPIKVVGPSGLKDEKLIFADTSECDRKNKGTPVFGTQTVKISGDVLVEIDVLVSDGRRRKNKVTLTSRVPIAPRANPIVMTNFFELCIPSVFNSAFLPRFAEFCNVNCEARIATNSIMRDITIDPNTGKVRINLIIAICISCEKKVIVPVQLCVLSTGFPVLSPEVSPICNTFPSLFPKQIDEHSDDSDCHRPRTFSEEDEVVSEDIIIGEEFDEFEEFEED